MLYLSIYEGDDPDTSQPVIGSTDPVLIRAVVQLIARRLRGGSTSRQPMAEPRTNTDSREVS